MEFADHRCRPTGTVHQSEIQEWLGRAFYDFSGSSATPGDLSVRSRYARTRTSAPAVFAASYIGGSMETSPASYTQGKTTPAPRGVKGIICRLRQSSPAIVMAPRSPTPARLRTMGEGTAIDRIAVAAKITAHPPFEGCDKTMSVVKERSSSRGHRPREKLIARRQLPQ